MSLSRKQLVIGVFGLALLSSGATVALVRLTRSGDDVAVPITNARRVAACGIWKQGAQAAAQTEARFLFTRGAHVAVFLDRDVSAGRRDQIKRFINAQPEVEKVHYESQEEAHRIFVQLFANEPDIIANTPAEALPPSFRVVLDNPETSAALVARLEDLAGVDSVRDDVRPAKVPVDGVLRKIRLQGSYVSSAVIRVPAPPGCSI
jgi:FtsX-like permease family protein